MDRLSILPRVSSSTALVESNDLFFPLRSFMLVVWAIGAAVTYIMLPVNWFMETIGFLAVFTEAMLGKHFSCTHTTHANFPLAPLRSATVPSQLQEQVNARHELPNGDHVDYWRRLQDHILHHETRPNAVLYLRNASGRDSAQKLLNMGDGM